MTEGEHSMEDRARIFAPVLAQVKRLADEGKPVAIAIDGRCGSGKTWLSGLIGDRFPCNILHMDDFYLPFGRRAQGWEAVPGGNMDFRRLRDELLIPIRAGQAAVYRAYLCPEGSCLKRVRKSRALERAFGLPIPEAVYDQLEQQMEGGGTDG